MKTESPFHEININVNNVKDILEVVLKSYADNPVFCFPSWETSLSCFLISARSTKIKTSRYFIL